MKSHVIRVQKLGENHSLGLQNPLAIVCGPISTYTCSQRPHIYAPSVFHARIRSYAISRFSCHHILHLLLLLYTRYLLTSTSSIADFFTEGLQFRRRCARTIVSSMASVSRAHAPGRGVVTTRDAFYTVCTI